MSLELGNILGAAASLTTALQQPKSLKEYLHIMSKFGIQVTNNFEINFSGLQDVTFFVTTINFDGIEVKTDEVYYDGQSIPIPLKMVYGHSGSMTVINDGNGYIYAALKAFVEANSNVTKVDNGYKLTIKCLTGDDKYKGSVITLTSIFFNKIDGLQFQYQGGDVSTFNVGFSFRDFEFTPGALALVGGINGTLNSLVG